MSIRRILLTALVVLVLASGGRLAGQDGQQPSPPGDGDNEATEAEAGQGALNNFLEQADGAEPQGRPGRGQAGQDRRGRGPGARRGRGGGRGRRGRSGDAAPTDVPRDSAPNRRLADFHVDDPFILADATSGTYYLYAASADAEGRAIVVAFSSPDLATWEGPQTVFAVPEGTWANPKDGVRAPEVHHYNGKYYLLVTLNNRDAIFAEPPQVWRANYRRGVVIAAADTPNGPFELLRTDWPLPPKDFMTLDGTLYVDPQGKPWLVYAHEWWQVLDGSIEAVPLSDDLTTSIADPVFLFKGSDGPWFSAQNRVTPDERTYVAEGPQVYRTRDGQLLILWSTHTIEHGYVQAVARSTSGELAGPWEQLAPLAEDDSGHGMVFEGFDGTSMMAMHGPYGVFARTQIYEVEDVGDRLAIVSRRADLDGSGAAGAPGADRRGRRAARGRRGGEPGGRGN